uniref:G_PROTEIN_RECEP_F1_2 domain-containing protein n=1 Tax=Haemonchus contortus TaxID=6289 RepID=A0A7I4YX82_HAECO
EMDVALYVANLAVNTVIIATDIVVIYITIKTKEIAEKLILWTIFLCMGFDIAAFLNTIIHDVPSYIMDEDLYKTPQQAYLSALSIVLQWYSQLFALVVLSVLHFIAAFYPTNFRTISLRHMHMINLFIVLVSILLAVPMFTPWCGYSYSIQSHNWFFDLSKPYSYVWWIWNIVLQTICAVVMAGADVAIIWKIRVLRIAVTKRKQISSSHPTANSVTETKSNKEQRTQRINREIRLAINFLLLSACFLIMTIAWNLPLRQEMWYDLFLKFTTNLNLSKWAIYTLGNAKIRQGFLRLCRCRQIGTLTTVTVVKILPTR